MKAIGFIAACLLCLPSTNCAGQWGDSFEGGEPRWQLVESDCQAELTEHSISLLMPHGGRTCEMLEVSCTHGTMALLAYPIEPCAILSEFRPRIWTRCSSGRIQIGARVIFPFASHPVTQGRLTTILWGDFYKDTGQWQMLQIANLEERFRQEAVALRQRFGGDQKLDAAYIDCLVVNAYTGPGRYRLQLDDLELRGIIPMAATGNPPPANWRENWRWRYEVPNLVDRYWSAPNRAPVWFQHRGESLPWIESLGFNGVVTNKLPSREWLAEAKLANLGVISPPPVVPVEYPDEVLPTVKGWLIGAALDNRQVEFAREQAEVIAGFPVALRKPMVAEALEDYFLFSRVADELIVPTPVSASAGSPSEKLSWLADNLSTARQRSDGWVSLSVGLNPPHADQIEIANRTLDPNHAQPQPTSDPYSLRHQVAGTIIAGANGVLFRTFQELDHQTAAGRVDVAALRWINNDLKLWGPWITGGQEVQAPVLNDSNWRSAAWSVTQSQLIIAQTIQEGSQYCLPPTRGKKLEFSHTLPTSGQQVFRLTKGTLDRVETQTTSVGLAWSIDDAAPTECFLVTTNPTVIRFVREQLLASAAQNAADQLEIVAYNLSIAAQVVAARRPTTASFAAPSAEGSPAYTLNLAQQQLDRAWQALRSQQPNAATQLMYAASDQVQAILFEAFQTAVSNLATPQASPFVTTPAGLSLHWKLADACQRSQWRDLALPGGDFADLPSMLDSGWSQQRRLEDRVDLRVELIPASALQSPGLRLAAYAKENASQSVAGGYEGASLRVRSAAAMVKAGQLVRVSAKARVLRSSPVAGSGLLVYDNQVGPSLGQLVQGNSGETVPVELYRFIVQDGEFRLLAECRGECDIVLDSITASVIEPATNAKRYFTTPLDALPANSTIDFPLVP